jgi:hypothetical protein
MNTTDQQLNLLNFPLEISRHRGSFSITKLNTFTNKFVAKLITNKGLTNVQRAIDNDSNPYDPTINYLTCIMELGILHELFNQSFASSSQTILDERLELLAWAINISVATELKLMGIRNIPSIANGSINIYFTWNNMEIILQRIMPIANQIDGAVPHEVENYINNLISTKL